MSNIIKITDFMAPELDIYARLSEGQLLNRHKPEEGIFIAESPKVVERALAAGCTPISMLMEDKHVDGQARHLIEQCPDIPVYTASFDVLTQLTGFKLTRGVLCAMRRPRLPLPSELIRDATRIAIMEEVMNPTNLGAIFRSAAALGIDCILLTGGCTDPLYRRCIRVSMGTVFQIPWTFLDIENPGWPHPGLEFIKNAGFKTASMALRHDTINIDAPILRETEKLAIILGTEGEGLMEDTISSCDFTIKIPMANDVDSLNVAAASAIAFWEMGKHKLQT